MVQTVTNYTARIDDHKEQQIQYQEARTTELRRIIQEGVDDQKNLRTTFETTVLRIEQKFEAVANVTEVTEEMQKSFDRRMERARRNYKRDQKKAAEQFQRQFNSMYTIMTNHLQSINAMVKSLQASVEDVRRQIQDMSRQLTMNLANEARLIGYVLDILPLFEMTYNSFQ